jgi:GT2 family glycosyltransferase
MARCIETLRGQRGDHELDILVVDSGSRDGTVQIAREHGARVLEIPPAEFHYSRTLNLGIEQVEGEIVLALSAHAIPVDDGWLDAMLAPFEDPEVAGVASRQVPWPGAPFREAHRLAETFTTAPRTYAAGDTDVLFSNAASAIRRSVWRDEPFTLAAAEDLEWAARVVAQGRKIVYEPAACVYHSHEDSPRALARRMIDLNRGGTLAVEDRRAHHTIREAATYLYRDLRLIVGLDEPLKAKLAHARDAVAMAVYYVADFSKAGSTAEHRRRHA